MTTMVEHLRQKSIHCTNCGADHNKDALDEHEDPYRSGLGSRKFMFCTDCQRWMIVDGEFLVEEY